MRKTFVFFIFTVLSNLVFAQEIIKIAEDVVDYKVDRIGNVYYFDAKNNITKYETKTKRYTRFADYKSGKISSIDVSNPLRILAFYADQSVLKFLDVNFTEINSLQIRNKFTDGWMALAASSNNNGIWLYDNLNRRLIKLDEQFNIAFQTGDLYLVLLKKINPNSLFEYADELYLADEKNGIFVFDLFGGYKRTIPIYAETILQLEFDKISFQKKDSYYTYQNFKIDTISTQLGTQQKPYFYSSDMYFYIQNNLLFLQKKN